MTRHVFTLCALFAAHAWAGGPVVLLEQKVAQFRDAAAGVKGQLSGATEQDVGDAAAADKLGEATVIVAVGQKALSLAKEKAPKVPTVFCLVLGATKDQLSDTVTGVPFEADPVDSLGKLKEVAPAVTKVGLLYNPAASDWFVTEAQRGAKQHGLTLVTRTVGSAQEVRDAARALLQQTELLWLTPDAKLFPKDLVLFLLTSAAERSVPIIGFLDSMAQAGALAAVSADYTEAGRRAGKLAAEIAAKPDGKRTPVPAAAWAPGRLTLNLKTAETMNIKPTATAQRLATQTFK